MKRLAQGAVLMELGVCAVRLAYDGYLGFVKRELRWPLAGSGLVLLALGVWTFAPALVEAFRRASELDEGVSEAMDTTTSGCSAHDSGEGGLHHGPAVGWMLAVPLAALVLVAPPPLGADAARRDLIHSAPPPAAPTWPPLPASVGGAVDLPLSTFVARARYGADTVVGVPVRLTGFVVADPGLPDGYLLVRFALACCAADAFASTVEVRDRGPRPPDDTWLVVEGAWRPPSPVAPDGPAFTPIIEASSREIIDPPADPYEAS